MTRLLFSRPDRTNRPATRMMMLAFLAIVGLLATSFTTAVTAQQISDQPKQPYEELIHQAQQLESQNKFVEATVVWNQVAASVGQVHGAESWQVTNARLASSTAQQQAGFSQQQLAQVASIRQMQQAAAAAVQANDIETVFQNMQQAEIVTAELFGEQSHLVAQIKTQNASLLHHTGQLKEAWELYREALGIARRAFGPQHPDTELIYYKLGKMLHNSGNGDRAIDHLKQAVNISKTVYGEQHPIYADRLTMVGVALHGLGQHEAALEYLLSGEKIQEQVLGGQHQRRAQTLKDIGVTYLSMRDSEQAIRFLTAATGIYETSFGEHGALTLDVKSLTATALAMGGKNDQAEQLLARVVIGNRETHGKTATLTAKSEFQLGILLGKRGDYENAGPLLKHALDSQTTNLGKEDRATQQTAAAYVSVLERTGRNDEATALRQAFTGTSSAQNPNINR